MMESKLSRYCEGVMEAAWLAAVLVTPLFFNVLSSRIFEPDKIALLRTLALIILGAWVVRLIEQNQTRSIRSYLTRTGLQVFLRTPLVKPVLFFSGVYLIATIFSITPLISVLGSYQRLQGAYTTFSYLIIFGALAVNLREKAQLTRLLTAIILASLPIALYGILQRYQLDPVPWGSDVSRRISSTLGNSIFIAAYLIMVFPLTLFKMFVSYRSIIRHHQDAILQVIQAAIYTLIAIVQIVAIYFSGSRGPVLGWMVGLFFMLVILTIWWGKKWATGVVVGSAFFAAGFLLLMNLAGGPFETLRASPAIGRFGLLLNAESNSALVRRYIWEGSVQLVAPHAALEFPGGETDRFNFMRPVTGYGPESMIVAYTPFYVPQLGIVERRNATPDRAHNETWDSVVTNGVLGLIAYVWLFSSVFYYGLKWMGLIPNSRTRRLFIIFLCSGSLFVGLFFTIWRGVAYLGVGIPFGLILGLFGYIVVLGFFDFSKAVQEIKEERNVYPPPSQVRRERFLVLLVLMTAILAHFVEINFGIAISVTRLYFWVFTALILVVGYLATKAFDSPEGELAENLAGQELGAALPSSPQISKGNPQSEKASASSRRKPRSPSEGSHKKEKARVSNQQRRAWVYESMNAGFLLGIILATFGYNFIGNPNGLIRVWSIIWQSFTRIQDGTVQSASILGLIGATWLLGSILITGEVLPVIETEGGHRSVKRRLQMYGLCGGISLLVGSAYWLIHAGMLAGIAVVSPGSLDEFLNQVLRYSQIFVWYASYLVGIVFLMAVGLSGRSLASQQKVTANRPLVTISGRIAVVVMTLLVGFFTFMTNLRTIQADIVFKLADTFANPGSWPVAIEVYKFANQMAPNEDYYSLFLGKAYLEQAGEIKDTAQVEQLFQEAEGDLLRAQAINPLNVDHTANLARLYSIWASRSVDPTRKNQRLSQSTYLFERALAMSPNNVRLWNERAYLAFQTGASEEGLERLQKALTLDPSYDWTYVQLGDYYQRRAEQAASPEQRNTDLVEAINSYRKALSLQGEALVRYNATISLGNAEIKLGRIREAIKLFEQVVKDYPNSPTVWRIYETLARLYMEEGDPGEALNKAQAAFDLAPDEQKGQIQEMINQIRIRQ